MRTLPRIAIEILAVAGALSSCGGGTGPAAPPAVLKWYTTCGDPVCSGYHGPFPGVPLCTMEKAGDPCAAANAQCDPVNSCDALLLCTNTDPKQRPGGCPVSGALYKRDTASHLLVRSGVRSASRLAQTR
jgi:hypothetical protein